MNIKRQGLINNLKARIEKLKGYYNECIEWKWFNDAMRYEERISELRLVILMLEEKQK